MVGAPQQRIIQVDIDPREIGKNIPVAVGIVGDAKAVLADMLDVGEPRRRTARGVRAGATGWSAPRRPTWRAWSPCWGPRRPMTQGRLAKEVGDYLADKNALFTIDGGSTLLWAFSYIRAFEPRQRFFFAGGGHLGTGQPIANALKLAHRNGLVVNFCGDGGFGMTLPELDTAARHGLTVVNIINNDGGWGMCKAGQLVPLRRGGL